MGSYIEFTVGGRDVPTYFVRRSPTNNWGFVMESCWGVLASFDLPKRPPYQHRITRRARSLRRRTRALRRVLALSRNRRCNVDVLLDVAHPQDETETEESHLFLG